MSANPAPVTTALLKGVFRIAKDVVRTTMEIQEQQNRKQESYQQPQPQRTNPSASTPIVVTVIAEPAPPHPAAYQQSYGSQPQNFQPIRSPPLVSTTLGLYFGVAECMDLAARKRMNGAAGNINDRWAAAMRTPLICCFLAIAIMLDRLALCVYGAFVMGFGNTIGFLLLLPHTLYNFYRSVICISPRLTCETKLLYSLLFPLFAFGAMFSVLLTSFINGLSVPCVSTPHPWSLPTDAVSEYWSQGRAWRKESYMQFESQEGPRYDFGILKFILILILPLLGAIFGAFSFLIVAILEAPRVWYYLSFRSFGGTTACAEVCLPCFMFTATLFAFGNILFGPFIGLASGFMEGMHAACHAPSTFFSGQIKNVKTYMNGLPTSSRIEGH